MHLCFYIASVATSSASVLGKIEVTSLQGVGLPTEVLWIFFRDSSDTNGFMGFFGSRVDLEKTVQPCTIMKQIFKLRLKLMCYYIFYSNLITTTY